MVYTYEEEKVTFTERSESSASAYPVDDDLSALQPFQQLGTFSNIVLVPRRSWSFVSSVLMNYTFVILSFSYMDKFSLEARIQAVSRMTLPNERPRDSTNKTKPNSGKNISNTPT